LLAGQPQGLGKTYDTQRLVLGPDQADFRGHDFPVQAVLAFLAVAAVAECSSDGQDPSIQFATKTVANTFESTPTSSLMVEISL